MKYFTKTYARLLRKQSPEVKEHAKAVIEANKPFVVEKRFGSSDRKYKDWKLKGSL